MLSLGLSNLQSATTSNNDYSIGGNKIGVHTLDLNTNFDAIKEQLDNIAVQYFT